MKPRGSNTGCGSKHLGEGRSQVAESPLPRLLPLPWPKVGTPKRVLGMRRASASRCLGVRLPSLRGERTRLPRMQGLRRKTALQVPTLDDQRVPQGGAGSCGPVDASIYALRHPQCLASRRRMARPDTQLPLLRRPHRLGESLLGRHDGRGDGASTQEGRVGKAKHRTPR